MTLQILWGLVLWFSISKYGLGVSTDAVDLLFGAHNLAIGKGLTTYTGMFLALWPPLYPLLLALVHLTSGLDWLNGAAVVQWLAFVGLAVTLSVMFLKVFEHNPALAVAAVLLAQAGSVMTMAFGMVGSDYVHVFLAMLCVLLVGRFVETGSPRAFLAFVGVGILVTLQRYLGVAAIAAGALTIMILARASIKERLLRASAACLAAVPMVVWLAITSQLYTRRAPIGLGDNFAWFSRSILEWWAGRSSDPAYLEKFTPLLWLVAAGLVFLVIRLSRGPRSSGDEVGTASAGQWFYLAPLLLYGACYMLALFGSASIAYYNKLGGRLLLPLYIPMITLPLAAADFIIQRVRRARPLPWRAFAASVCYVAVGALLLATIRTTVPLIIQSHANGIANGENVFNDRTWNEKSVVNYLTHNMPVEPFTLLSNVPDGVAFSARRGVLPSPKRRAGPYAVEDFPLEMYRASLSAGNGHTYLIWLEPSPHDYYYTPDELDEVAVLETLYADASGGIYRVLPRQ
ncbi:MAG TPA: hypothetical protein VIU38_05730 [Anaerolineales bacterium]